MHDSKYCYPGSEVLKNKLNIEDKNTLFEAEKELTAIRLRELQENPMQGKYDFVHLKAIHKYIFQDVYEWAGKERTVEIGKGNLFCTTACIQDYANSVFNKYFLQCYAAKEDFDSFIKVFSDNYGDLNALHPFREGNGRAQREFARMICLACGYDFNLSCTTHKEMLAASILSFDKGDSSLFVEIFSRAVTPHDPEKEHSLEDLYILTSDDLVIELSDGYDYYDYSVDGQTKSHMYNEMYKSKIHKMNAEKEIGVKKAPLDNKIEKAKNSLEHSRDEQKRISVSARNNDKTI